jgi:lipoic acid synthetase
VRYQDAHALQHALLRRSSASYLLLLEHPHVYTMGLSAKPEHVLIDPAQVGAELIKADRGGDVTYHGPGQLVGYPIVTVPMAPGAIPGHVHRIEDFVIAILEELGVRGAGRLFGYPGVWLDPESDDPRKICAIGVRVSKGRSMHGFALNVTTDLSMFSHIVPCGIADKNVTSLANEGIDVTLADVVEIATRLAPDFFAGGEEAELDEQRAVAPSVASVPVNFSRALDRRLAAAGVDPNAGHGMRERKPEWLRVEAKMGEEYLALRRTMRSLKLVTVCEEAGCPNIYECWADGTATFMINGERCTRACAFCLVDTRHPFPLDPTEPDRVAKAVADMQLGHAVITAVARDDLDDGGAAAFAETIAAVRRDNPGTTVEVLIPDLKGDERSLQTIFAAKPDVLNHNLETVLRLQRAIRPSASYARSLSVLARARDAGLVTKSGIILGMGEDDDEVVGALADLRAVGVEIVTIGQYLRPSEAHLPVVRFVEPAVFERLGGVARSMGFRHVESSPLTRSSYHARRAVDAQTSSSGGLLTAG